MRRKITATIAAAAALWLSCLVNASFESAAAAADDSRWGADFFPNVTFTTYQGKSVRFYDDLIKGKIVAVDLIYTTCKYACPLETARLAQVQRLLGDRMGRDVFFYSITIDPDHDTPAVLAEYAEKYRAGPGWLFLTGAKADIELVGRKLGIYAGPDPTNADGHVPYLLVGNQATGQWMLRAEYRQVRMPNLKLNDEDVSAVIDYLEGQNRAAQQAPPPGPVAATASSRPAAEALTAIVDAYLRIQQALHADATERIREPAGVIETEARNLASVGEPIRTSAAALMRADDLKAARAAFGTLGDAIMSYVKASGSRYGDGVTAAFCPMVQKYWLQRGDTVQNPFYGKAMSDCGRVVR